MKPFRERAHVVCVQCHSRKVKCDLQTSSDETCRNCRRSNQTCIRRNGVRKKNPVRSRVSAAGGTHQADSDSCVVDELRLPSPTESPSASASASASVIASPPAPFRESFSGGSFIADGSVLSYGSPSNDATPSRRSAVPGSSSSSSRLRDVLISTIQPYTLPRPALVRAFTDAFFEHVWPMYPVVDASDVLGPGASVLLRQAVCLVGSLTRHSFDMEFAAAQYEKIKLSVFLNCETDNVVLLKMFCLMTCWSRASTELVRIDGPWQWAGMAIRLAFQMGLHKHATYADNPDSACLRRIFWHLVNVDKMMVACWGRPLAIRPEDCDVPIPSVQDFPSTPPSHYFLEGRKIVHIIGAVGELNIRKRPASSAEVSQLVKGLTDWQMHLPAEVRLYDPDGTKRPYNRLVSELSIHYFVAIILIQTLTHKLGLGPVSWAPSLIASSCIASLYEEIHTREQTIYLLHYHGFLCMVAAMPILCRSRSSLENDAQREEELHVLCDVLESMKSKYGGAEFVLGKIERLRRNAGGLSKLMGVDDSAVGFGSADGIESCLDQLFPFPLSFCSGMEMLGYAGSLRTDLLDSFAPEAGLTLLDMMEMDICPYNLFGPDQTPP